MWSASTYLHRCVLQSHWLHSRNIWLCQKSIYNLKFSFSPHGLMLSWFGSSVIIIIIIILLLWEFFTPALADDLLISLFTFFQFYSVVCPDSKIYYLAGSFFGYWLSQGLVMWLRLGEPFVSQNYIEVCASHFPGQIFFLWYYCHYSPCKFFIPS